MQRLRTKRGSGTVEGVVGLWLVVVAIVLGTLLLVSAGMATYCKEKLGFVANQAADYAAVLPNDGARHGLVLTEVKQLLSTMGFPTNNTQVAITDPTFTLGGQSRPAVAVTVSTPFSTFLTNVGGQIIPPQITLSDSAVALTNGWYPAYAVVVNLQGQKTLGLMINGTGTYPSDSLPVYGFNYFISNLLNLRL